MIVIVSVEMMIGDTTLGVDVDVVVVFVVVSLPVAICHQLVGVVGPSEDGYHLLVVGPRPRIAEDLHPSVRDLEIFVGTVLVCMSTITLGDSPRGEDSPHVGDSLHVEDSPRVEDLHHGGVPHHRVGVPHLVGVTNEAG